MEVVFTHELYCIYMGAVQEAERHFDVRCMGRSVTHYLDTALDKVDKDWRCRDSFYRQRYEIEVSLLANFLDKISGLQGMDVEKISRVFHDSVFKY